MNVKQKLKNDIIWKKIKINNDLHELQDMEKISNNDVLAKIYCLQVKQLEVMGYKDGI